MCVCRNATNDAYSTPNDAKMAMYDPYKVTALGNKGITNLNTLYKAILDMMPDKMTVTDVGAAV